MLKELDKILGNLIFYIDPNLLQSQYLLQLKKGRHYSQKISQKYLDLIMDIDWFIKKIAKYRLYFLCFYPKNAEIKEADALEHHIHAYLEDMETLKNRLIGYIGTLRNDLKKVASNKNEIVKSLKNIESVIYKTFKNVSANRGPHRHVGSRFIDIYSTKSRTANFFVENKIFGKQLTPYGFNKYQTQESEALLQGKKYWSERAMKNDEQILGLTEEIFLKTKRLLYTLLDIVPINVE